MKRLKQVAILTGLAAILTGGAMAQTAVQGTASANTGVVSKSADMAEGEIKKDDKATKKLTIKHGEIKNLDMPGMTMLFQVKDPAMLDMVKAGDKVKFKAENNSGAIVVTEIQIAR